MYTSMGATMETYGIIYNIPPIFMRILSYLSPTLYNPRIKPIIPINPIIPAAIAIITPIIRKMIASGLTPLVLFIVAAVPIKESIIKITASMAIPIPIYRYFVRPAGDLKDL